MPAPRPQNWPVRGPGAGALGGPQPSLQVRKLRPGEFRAGGSRSGPPRQTSGPASRRAQLAQGPRGSLRLRPGPAGRCGRRRGARPGAGRAPGGRGGGAAGPGMGSHQSSQVCGTVRCPLGFGHGRSAGRARKPPGGERRLGRTGSPARAPPARRRKSVGLGEGLAGGRWKGASGGRGAAGPRGEGPPGRAQAALRKPERERAPRARRALRG